MTSTQENPYILIINMLSNANQLSVKAFNAKSAQNLIFVILNDTLHVLPYDQAVMWRVTENKGFELLGVSGQSTFTKNSEVVNRWKTLLSSLPDLKKIKNLSAEDFPGHVEDWNQIQKKNEASVVWVPIHLSDKEIVGVWFEKWNDPNGQAFSADKMKIVQNYLVPGFAAAWNKLFIRTTFKQIRTFFNKQRLAYFALGLLALFILIRIPLRIVAPCEVVAKDPYLITAPLDGIIAHVTIKPGQQVKVGDVLYEYDPRIPLQELKIAQKQLEITKADIDRSIALGVEQHQDLSDLAALNLKKQKAELDLEFAKARAQELIGKSPREGVVLIDNPDEWQGKPVKIGEKIMTISDPLRTKVRIWIPENDNIHFDLDKPVKVYLNPDPEKSYEIKLNFIAKEASISEKHVSSFLAEGDWKQPQSDVKLGVKGSAVLYGERVSLFYYIFRKPLMTLRDLIGI